MNEEDFGFVKVLKLKYRRGDQIMQTFRKIPPPKNFVPPSLTRRDFNTLRKVLLNDTKCIEI